MHRVGPRANEAVELVGYIRVDLDTPTPVLREFVRRFCGGWLNEHGKVCNLQRNHRECETNRLLHGVGSQDKGPNGLRKPGTRLRPKQLSQRASGQGGRKQKRRRCAAVDHIP